MVAIDSARPIRLFLSMDFLTRPFLLLCAVATTALGVNSPPVVDDPVPTPNKGVVPQFPVGKTLIFPITAVDADAGDELTYKVTSNNPKILVRVKTGNPTLRFTVNYGAAQPGVMEFLLFREWTPLTNGFIGGFAQSGFYDNVKFHRVIKNFVIQGGDPLGTGTGGPGMTGGDPSTAFKFENEFLPGLEFTGRGQLAMANSGYASDSTGTNGSQFFVTLEQLHVPTSVHQLSLDFKHTIFGQMIRGWDVLDAIANLPVDSNDKPTPDVVITSAVVEPNVRDAVLMISATGRVLPAAPATITVTADDGHGGKSTKSFTVSAVDDGANSPPVLQNLAPLTVAKETQLDFPLKTFDLEADYLFVNHGLLGTGGTHAASTTQGFGAAVRGNAGFEGQVQMGFEISQFNVGEGQAESPIVQSFVPIGIGDRAVRSAPMSVTATPAAAFTGVVARFQDLDPAGVAADYTTPASDTTINWGDGTPEENGALAPDTTVPGPANFAVSGTHTYAKPGVYTIVVTTTGNKGAVGVARTQAVVTAGTIVAEGEELEVKGLNVANRIIATFTDSNAPGRPADYAATVDWGDGQSSKGVISKRADKSFVVRGTHAYKDAEPFAISVHIEKGATDAFAWSRANVSGPAPAQHLPPFPMVHLVGAWNSGPTKQVTGGLNIISLDPTKLTETFTGAFVVFNSGTKPSATSLLRFFLSAPPINITSFTAASPTVITTAAPHGLATGDEVIIDGVIGGTFSPAINGNFTATVVDATHFTVPASCFSASVTTPGTVFSRTSALTGATKLTVNALPEISITGFPPGSGGQGQFTIALPKLATGTGRYLLSQLVYSDPIIDASKVDKVVINGLIGGVYAYNTVSDVGITKDGLVVTSESGAKATFKVVLDTAPTADVTIAVESSLTTEGTVSPASLTFTPANWNTAQTVTVTGVNDATQDGNRSYTVTLKTPVSTDPRYSGSDPLVFSFLNLDND